MSAMIKDLKKAEQLVDELENIIFSLKCDMENEMEGLSYKEYEKFDKFLKKATLESIDKSKWEINDKLKEDFREHLEGLEWFLKGAKSGYYDALYSLCRHVGLDDFFDLVSQKIYEKP